jgi:hypothetical protein
MSSHDERATAACTRKPEADIDWDRVSLVELLCDDDDSMDIVILKEIVSVVETACPTAMSEASTQSMAVCRCASNWRAQLLRMKGLTHNFCK